MISWSKSMEEEHSDIRSMVREAIEDFFKAERERTGPEQQTALTEERSKRESLEHKVNELSAETEKARARAEEAERSATIRAELQRAGVTKLELAYKAIKDDIYRGEDGRLVAQGGAELRDCVTRFVGENPELLPARLAGGSGAVSGQRTLQSDAPVDLDRIRPGMNPEELERVRQEISRVASQTLRGW
jgi:hypothetical protein